MRVVIETVAAQEYLAQDAEKFMPVKRVERTKDKIARAYWLQAYFENKQILFPAKHLASDYSIWQAFLDELLLFPQGEHDDLFDGLQTMVEGSNYPTFNSNCIRSGNRLETCTEEFWEGYL